MIDRKTGVHGRRASLALQTLLGLVGGVGCGLLGSVPTLPLASCHFTSNHEHEYG
jgi:hypothetical protein